MITNFKVGGKKIEVTLTWKEIKYFLFKKKKCTTCGSKMKKVHIDTSLGNKAFVDDDLDGKTANFHTERIIRTYAYRCNNCNVTNSLESLIKD